MGNAKKMDRRIKTKTMVGALIVILAVALLISTQGSLMFKVCIFSPVKGKVVQNGQPIVGAVVERSYDWAWGSKKGGDQTVTDQNGDFVLPGIYESMVLGKVIPHEPVVGQKIAIKAGGKTFNAWSSSKHNYDEFGELRASRIEGGLGGRPISLYCALETPSKNHGGVLGYGGMAELRQN